MTHGIIVTRGTITATSLHGLIIDPENFYNKIR